MSGAHSYATALSETQVSTVEAAFQDYIERKDIAILLINQHVRSSRCTFFVR